MLEIAFKIVDLQTGEIKASYSALIKQSEKAFLEADPMSLRVNGFSLEKVENGLELGQVSKQVIAMFKQAGIVRGQAVFICQNPSFDRAFFAQIVGAYDQEAMRWPYHWLDLASMFWCRTVDRERSGEEVLKEGFTLSKDAIAKVYGIGPEEKPHRAMNGVEHLIKCYEAVVGYTKALKLTP